MGVIHARLRRLVANTRAHPTHELHLQLVQCVLCEMMLGLCSATSKLHLSTRNARDRWQTHAARAPAQPYTCVFAFVDGVGAVQFAPVESFEPSY
jgi:hypothetical protein